MGVPVLIIGESGSGKSHSIKGLPPEGTGIFSVEKGRLPFKGDYKVKPRATYRDINGIFKRPKHPISQPLIDRIQNIFSF